MTVKKVRLKDLPSKTSKSAKSVKPARIRLKDLETKKEEPGKFEWGDDDIVFDEIEDVEDDAAE